MAGRDENPHDGHRERMRQRYLKSGLKNFHDHESLEMLLFFNIKRGNTNETAHALLSRFGSLHGVLRASREELISVPGVGESTAFYLGFLHDFFHQTELSRASGLSLQKVENRFRYFRTLLCDCTDENILVACLTDDLCVDRCVTVAKGSPNHVTVEMRSLAKVILDSGTSYVMLAHNHPRGKAIPSREDMEMTRNIAKLLRNLSVELIDHIIIAGEDACSMRQDGTYEPSML